MNPEIEIIEHWPEGMDPAAAIVAEPVYQLRINGDHVTIVTSIVRHPDVHIGRDGNVVVTVALNPKSFYIGPAREPT